MKARLTGERQIFFSSARPSADRSGRGAVKPSVLLPERSPARTKRPAYTFGAQGGASAAHEALQRLLLRADSCAAFTEYHNFVLNARPIVLNQEIFCRKPSCGVKIRCCPGRPHPASRPRRNKRLLPPWQACLDWNVRRSGKSGGIPDGLPAAGPLRGKNKSFLRNAGPGDLVEIGRVIGYNKNIQLKFMEAST